VTDPLLIGDVKGFMGGNPLLFRNCPPEALLFPFNPPNESLKGDLLLLVAWLLNKSIPFIDKELGM